MAGWFQDPSSALNYGPFPTTNPYSTVGNNFSNAAGFLGLQQNGTSTWANMINVAPDLATAQAAGKFIGATITPNQIIRISQIGLGFVPNGGGNYTFNAVIFDPTDNTETVIYSGPSSTVAVPGTEPVVNVSTFKTLLPGVNYQYRMYPTAAGGGTKTIDNSYLNIQQGTCPTGIAAPALTGINYNTTTKAYIIPTGSSAANLSGLMASNPNSTYPVISWHSGTPATSLNRITNITAVTSGNYYAAFATSDGACFSNTLAVCIGNDNDGDDLPNNCDLDDDNDGILDTSEDRCDAPTYANSNTGSGAFQDQLYFFDWSGIGGSLNNGDSQTFTINDLVVTANFSNVIINGGAVQTADLKTWSDAEIGDLYNTAGSNETLYGQNATTSFSFTVNFSATKNGVPYPLDIIAFDAESTTAALSESIVFQSNGGNWVFFEGINGRGGATQGNFTLAGNSLTVVNTFDGNVGNSLFYSKAATTINVSVVSPGTQREGVGFAIWLRCDTDNDGLINSLDPDSDNDGCPDAIEGGGAFNNTNTTPFSPGPPATGGTIIGTVDANGVPEAAGTSGQTVGTSANAGVKDAACTTPIATNDVDTYTPGIPKNISILPNDITGSVVDPATVLFTTTGAPSGSILSPDGKTLTTPEGIWTVNSSGVATFSPASGFTGNPIPASYTVKDVNGNISNEATITLTADPLPLAVNDVDTYTPGVPKTLNATGNDTGGDAVVPSTFEFTLTGAPAGSTLSPDGKTLTTPEGVWTVNTTGDVTFSPASGFTGNPVPATYSVEDAQGNPTTATITLTADPLPLAVNDVDTYTPGVPKTLNVTGNDTGGDSVVPSTFEFTLTGAPAGSTLSPDGKTLTTPEGIWTVNTTGDVTFSPASGFTGNPVPATYSVEDAQGNPTTATITLTADPLPLAVNDVGTYTPGVPKTLNVTGNDTGGDAVVPSTFEFTLTGAPAGSTLSPDGKTLTTPEGVWTVNTTGDVTFSPASGFTGNPVPATYSVEDAQGNPTTATITLTADPLPLAVNDVDTYTPGVPKTLNVTGNDTGGDSVVPSTFEFTLTGAPAGSTLSPDGKTLTTPEGIWTVNTTGDVTFSPASGFTGNPVPATYSVEDAQGNPTTATITLTADPLPLAVNDVGTYTPGVPKTLNATGNDTGGDTVVPSTFEFTLTGAPAGSTLSPDGKTLTTPEGVWTVNTTGDVTFSPASGFTGNPVPATYSVEDAQGNPTTATITLTADPLPLAVNDVGTYTPGVPKTLNVTGNDTGGDAVVPSTFEFTLTGAPAGSTLSPDGKTLTTPEGIWTVNTTGDVTFSPASGFTGNPVPATYSVEDAQGNPTTATITLTADPLPLAVNDVGTYTPGVPKTLNATGNDTGGDTVVPSTFEFTLTGAPAGSTLSPDGKTLTTPEGVWTVNTTGDVTFSPASGFTGNPVPATYSVEDAQGNPTTATITLTADPLPLAVNDVGTYTPGVPKTLNVTGNDTGGDAVVPSTFEFTLTGAPAGSTLSPDGKTLTTPEGIWTVNTTGDVTFSPASGFTGNPVPATYSVEDAQGNPTTATITLTADPLPLAVNDVGTYTPGVPKTLNATGNDTGGDTVVPSTFEFTLTGAPAGSTLSPDGKTLTTPEGVWTVNTTGDVTFSPASGFTGNPVPATYSVEDAQGNPTTATITLTACTIDIGGTIFVGSVISDGVNGAPLDGTTYDMYVSLIQNNINIGVQKVKADGTYLFENKPAGTYNLVIGNLSGGTSFASAPSLTLYTFVGEGGPVTAGQAQGDGTPDGRTTIIIDCANIIYEQKAKVAATVSYLDNDFEITNVSLPISLIKFEGKQIDEQINLNWKTANEKDFSHFEVQKSSDGKEFGAIGSVQSGNLNLYNFIDKNAEVGINYYRLKMVDLDGTFNYSKIINVNFDKNNNYLIASNPVENGEILLRTNLPLENFKLMNTLGSKIPFDSSRIDSNSYLLKLKNYSTGIYYLVTEDKGKSYITKLLIR